jgi:drug/metabolite transporter (DMT)-like permease
MIRNRVGANVAAATAAILFGASVVAVRIAVRDVPPLTLAFLRFGQGSLVLLVALVAFNRDLLPVQRRDDDDGSSLRRFAQPVGVPRFGDLPFFALLGALLFTIFPYTFNAGLRYNAASRAALILATMPLMTVVISRFASRERLTTKQVGGMLTSIAGVAIVLADRGGASVGSVKGDLLLLTTALCGAIYNVLVKRVLTRYSGLTVTFYAMLFGSLFLAPAAFAESGLRIAGSSGQTLAMIVFLGVFGGALGFSLWTAALKQLSPTQVAVYINLNPVAATLLAATILHEQLSGYFGVGFIAVVAGVMIVNRPSARHPEPYVADAPQGRLRERDLGS